MIATLAMFIWFAALLAFTVNWFVALVLCWLAVKVGNHRSAQWGGEGPLVLMFYAAAAGMVVTFV